MSAPGQGRLPAWVVLLVAVLAVSWSSILIRWCEAPALGIAFWRLLLSTLVLVPFAARPPGKAPRRTWLWAIGAGVLLSIHFATWITSLDWTSVGSSVVLVSAHPVFTAVLGPMIVRERPGPRGLLAVGVAMIGVLVLVGGDLRVGGRAVVGDLLALCGALAAAAYLMVGRRVREQIPFLRYLVMVNGTAALVTALLALPAGISLTGYPLGTWLLLVLLTLGPQLTGHGLLNWSVRRFRALTVNMALLGEPILATTYAAFIFREIPRPSFYAGTTLIVIGIALATREERDGSAGGTVSGTMTDP